MAGQGCSVPDGSNIIAFLRLSFFTLTCFRVEYTALRAYYHCITFFGICIPFSIDRARFAGLCSSIEYWFSGITLNLRHTLLKLDTISVIYWTIWSAGVSLCIPCGLIWAGNTFALSSIEDRSSKGAGLT